MFTYGKSKAEQQREVSERRAERAQNEKDEAQRLKADRMAKQRALRLGVRAANKENHG